MKKNIDILYDLENSPLMIKTDSAIGSGKQEIVKFYPSEGQQAGGIIIRLQATPQYYLYGCRQSYTDLSTPLPADDNRILTITKTSDPLGILVHCNDKEILNLQFSNTTCIGGYYKDNWRKYWGQQLKRIYFHSWNSASNFYHHPTGKFSISMLFRYFSI